ncbi:hypothetical protein COBT_001416 [Conglomerata obtusa]
MRDFSKKRKTNKFIDSTSEILKSFQINDVKRNRIKLSDEQVSVLELSFWEDNHPSSAVKEELAHVLDIPLKNVQIWFQNRRAKRKSEKEAIQHKYNRKVYQKEREYVEHCNSTQQYYDLFDSRNYYQQCYDQYNHSDSNMLINNMNYGSDLHFEDILYKEIPNEKNDVDIDKNNK